MGKKSYRVYEKDNSAVQEAFRALRANILFSSYGKEIKTITITSCNPGEGKTITALNLVITMAKSGRRVLLIDADLRKPSAMKYMDYSNKVGLTDLIGGCVELEAAVQTTDIEDFYILGCGPIPDNPTEILESSRFTDILNEVREKYDMVIIDTPPLGSVIDGAIVASRTDGALLVIRSKTIPLQNARMAKEQLEKAGAKLLGAVLNRVSASEYKNYYGHYNYYGKAKKSKGILG